MIAEQEKIERNALVRSELASQHIEGLEPDATVIEDAKKWARGEMTIADAVTKYKARAQHDMA